MPKNTIEIKLIASKRAGILPGLMRKLGSFGLIYRRCNVQEYSTGVKLTLVCEGDLDCDQSFFIKSIKEVPNVESILNVTQSKTKAAESFKKFHENINDFTELHPLRANDPITQDVMHIVDDRLSEVFGPTANLLLKSAAKKSSCVGQLFLILAEELDFDQKVVFLRDIEGLEDMLLSEADET